VKATVKDETPLKAELLAKLKEIPLFAEIKDRDEYMNELLAISRLRSYSSGECIIKEGEVGDELFIAYTGGVEIKKKTRAGDDYTVGRLSAEQNVFFGELGLIDNDTRSATVIATRDSSFLVINKKDFLDLGRRQPQIAFPVTLAISRKISSFLRKTTEDMLTIFDALVNEIKG
jgi:CRP/FNR family cyclic AMP-dependent transcriptional regulator